MTYIPNRAPKDPSFVTLGTNSEIPNERVLTAGQGVTLTDAGAGSTLTVGLSAAFSGARVYHSTTQSITTSGTAQALVFDTEAYDTDAYHSTVSNTSRLTAPVTGKYHIEGVINYASNATGNRRAQVRLNGTTTIASGTDTVSANSGFTTFAHVACDYSLAAGDYVELMATQNSGGALDANGNLQNAFSIHLVPGDAGVAAPASTIFVATTGSDTTGDGTSGTPYATVAKALSRLPSTIKQLYTIDVADGTYAEGIDLGDFVCTDGGSILITGNTGTPANVTFTGTTSVVWDNGATRSTCIAAAGPVQVELEGIRTNATATWGVGVLRGARVVIDRCTIAGTTSNGLAVLDGAWVELHGSITISGFSSSAGNGIVAYRHGRVDHTVTGTLTVTGPDGSNTASGISASLNSIIRATVGATWSVTGVMIGLGASLCSVIQHWGTGGGSVTVDNTTKPANSRGFRAGDCSTVSCDRSVTLDQLTIDFHAEANSYVEASGSRTTTNITTPTSHGATVQGSYVNLP